MNKEEQIALELARISVENNKYIDDVIQVYKTSLEEMNDINYSTERFEEINRELGNYKYFYLCIKKLLEDNKNKNFIIKEDLERIVGEIND